MPKHHQQQEHYRYDDNVNTTSESLDDLQLRGSATGIEINIPTNQQQQDQENSGHNSMMSMESASRELQKMQQQRHHRSHHHRSHSHKLKERQVYYNEGDGGATDLFLACEDTEWRRALQVIQDEPEQCCTWVVSGRSNSMTEELNAWRRLPLHEACRRQAPAWLISALLSVYPQAAKLATQFGELPLHLAVECGSAPEVVNLLVVAYWHGIVRTDQSGRTPRAILQEATDSAELLDMEDHKAVFESLLRSEDTYQNLLEQHEGQIKTLQQRHESGILAMEADHANDLKKEEEKYEALAAELKRTQMLLRASELSDTHNVEKLQEYDRQALIWQDHVTSLQDDLAQKCREKEHEQSIVKQLQETLEQKNHEIAALQDTVATLQGDLQNVVAWNDQVLQSKVQQTEQRLQSFVREFLQLRNTLGEKGDDAKDLLAMRGIAIPHPPKEDEKKVEEEEHVHDPNLEQDTLDQDAMDQAAAAASSALKFE